ncbi:MAG: hypothetical protein ACLQSR_05715 [Limisphaerales bacterium]
MIPDIIAALIPDVINALIPIVAIVMGIGIGMLSIYLTYRKRKEMFALYHQERMAAIEKGIELPPLPEDFFRENGGRPHRRSPHRTLLYGLVLVFIGLTSYLALHFTVPRTEAGGDPALYALIPGGIGAACLIYYFTVGRRLAAEMEEERKARLAEAARARNLPA